MNSLVDQLPRPVARWLGLDRHDGTGDGRDPTLVQPLTAGVRVRRRSRSDVDSVVRILRGISSGGRYPDPKPPSHRALVTEVLDAWVAERQGLVVGHVALAHPASPAVSVLRWREVTGHEPEDLAEVVAFFVQRHERGQGIGSALLATAAQGARARGLRPAIRVVTQARQGVPLVARQGWRLADQHSQGNRSDERWTYLYDLP